MINEICYQCVMAEHYPCSANPSAVNRSRVHRQPIGAGRRATWRTPSTPDHINENKPLCLFDDESDFALKFRISAPQIAPAKIGAVNGYHVTMRLRDLVPRGGGGGPQIAHFSDYECSLSPVSRCDI